MADAATVAPSAASRSVGSIEQLRRVGKLEAISFLLLLGVAMPLKYLAGVPLAVKIVGWAHGVLFVAFIAVLWRATRRAPLSLSRALLVFVAALLPFGPFLIDSRLEAFAREKQSAPPAA